MAKRMRYDNERFAKDFAKNFPKLGVDTQEEAGEKLGVSQNAIHSWLAGSSFPQKDKWKVIAENLGIDPSDYRVNVQGGSQTVTGNVSANGNIIIATNEAKVKSNHSIESSILTPKEQEALRLLRKHGDRALDAETLRSEMEKFR